MKGFRTNSDEFLCENALLFLKTWNGSKIIEVSMTKFINLSVMTSKKKWNLTRPFFGQFNIIWL